MEAMTSSVIAKAKSSKRIQFLFIVPKSVAKNWDFCCFCNRKLLKRKVPSSNSSNSSSSDTSSTMEGLRTDSEEGVFFLAVTTHRGVLFAIRFIRDDDSNGHKSQNGVLGKLMN